MADSSPPPHHDALDVHEPSPDEQLQAATRNKARSRMLWLLIALVAIAVFGVIGQLSGTGWFGHRAWMYEGGELYILNRSDAPVLASVDGFKDVEVPADNAQRLDLVGGHSTVTIKDAATNEVLSTHEVDLDGFHALLKLQPEQDCLAIVDVSGYYSGKRGARPIVVDEVRADRALYYFETRNVIWPRKAFPPRIDPALGEARWAEIVGCDLFEDREFLESYLGYRLEEAFKKMKERQKAQQAGAR